LENNANVRETSILFTTLHCNLQLDLLDPHNSLNGYGPFVVITILSFPRSGLITGFAAKMKSEEAQTIQWPKVKGQKEKHQSTILYTEN
jgi:hypothetical protein